MKGPAQPAAYRKKPICIQAIQVPRYRQGQNITRYLATAIAIAEYCGGTSHLMNADDEDGGPHILIPTLEGTMRANPGDYIIKGVKGEFYPCKPDIFYATYEPANEQRTTSNE